MPDSTNRARSDLRSVVYSRAHKPVDNKLVIHSMRNKDKKESVKTRPFKRSKSKV